MSVIVLLTLTFGCYTNTGASSTPTPVAAVSANTYYVSVSGNDNNPGTQAQPWKTLAKVNGYNFLPGDVIYFERGSIWSGGLIISKSGTAVSPITF